MQYREDIFLRLGWFVPVPVYYPSNLACDDNLNLGLFLDGLRGLGPDQNDFVPLDVGVLESCDIFNVNPVVDPTTNLKL